jgi:hypothetical protein
MIPINITLIVLFGLDFFGKLPVYWNLLWVFYLVLMVDTTFLILRIKHISEYEREEDYTVFYFKYLFLLGLIILVINQFLNRTILTQYMNYIIGVVIALGFLTFFASRERVEREIDDEKENEDQAERRRKEEFNWKFPRIAKLDLNYGFKYAILEKNIPLLIFVILFCPFVFLIRLVYKLIKWMYKEGWSFSIPFFIIVIIFITVKIAMPIIYTGSYLDEYNHILSGIEFFKTGHFAELYKGEYYNRGAYVSFLLGLFFKLFGQTIFVAKMVPALVGIIDFFLLFFISKKIIIKKNYILLLMIIYTLSPWIIFNHFYIRMYVFYEFFLLIFILLMHKVYENLKIKNNSRVIFYLIIISFLAILIYYLSNDIGSIMAILIVPIFIMIIYLFNIKDKKILKIILLILLIWISFILFNGVDKINTLLYGSLQYSTPPNLKYDYYFFNQNAILSIFFILSISIIQFKKKDFNLFLILYAELIFFIHLISSSDLQILRGIIYFFPTYYLISIYSLSRLNVNKIIKIILILLFFIVLFNNYLSDFGKGPYISNEVAYKDYKLGSESLFNNFNNNTILISSLPYINHFYGVNNNIYLLRDNPQANYDSRLQYFDSKKNMTLDTISNDIVIEDNYHFNKIVSLKNKRILIMIDTNFRNWISLETQRQINSEFNLVYKFNNIEIYKKDN